MFSSVNITPTDSFQYDLLLQTFKSLKDILIFNMFSLILICNVSFPSYIVTSETMECHKTFCAFTIKKLKKTVNVNLLTLTPRLTFLQLSRLR